MTSESFSNASAPSGNETDGAIAPLGVVQIVLLSTVFGVISIFTVVSNLLVIIAVKTNKQLQTITNYFLLSLAVADAMIGFVSMPLFTVMVIMQYWPLGELICDSWLAIDYTVSNASVANLMIITCDRYLSVTRPLTYRAKRTGKHVAMMIISAWIISIALWTPWIYAWPHIEGQRTVPETKCFVQFLYTNAYITLSTAASAYYLPVVIMCILYWRVFSITKQRTRELSNLCAGKRTGGRRMSRMRPSAPTQLATPNGLAPNVNKVCLVCTKTLFCRWRIGAVSDGLKGDGPHIDAKRTTYTLKESFVQRGLEPKPNNQPGGLVSSSGSTSSQLSAQSTDQQNKRNTSHRVVRPLHLQPQPPQQATLTKKQRSSESKAAKTISAILAAFILTWTPYNVFTVIQVFYPDAISDTAYNLGYYLCYLNSSINPIVYCLTNNNFKQSFARLLGCTLRTSARNMHSKQLVHSSTERALSSSRKNHVQSSVSSSGLDESRRKRTFDLFRRQSTVQKNVASPEVSQNEDTIIEEQPLHAQSCLEIPTSIETISVKSGNTELLEPALHFSKSRTPGTHDVPQELLLRSSDEVDDKL